MQKLIAVTVLALAACGLKGIKDTNKPAGPSTWASLEQRAQAAGYTTVRKDEGSRDGSWFWYVKATYASGTIYFMQNNSTKNVAYNCDGSLGDKGSCDQAAGELLKGP